MKVKIKILNYLLICFILAGFIGLAACDKNNPLTPILGACSGSNLCFKMNGTQYTMNANWTTPPSRNRIPWEEGSGANYKNIELDIYGNSTGAYNVDTSSSASNRATFQYFINDGGSVTNIQGLSGTVNLTEITTTTISGNFTITAKDQTGVDYTITEGNFVSVPKP
ncbi:MAG TPA: DUF6252 family protein [Ignavibacteria bacterium]|nr:DUF6252 family protein [Ignavibacteria bacterium]